MRAVRNGRSGIWHLLGTRGCGVDPDGDAYGRIIDDTWAVIRDQVDRDTANRCSRCRWPPR